MYTRCFYYNRKYGYVHNNIDSNIVKKIIVLWYRIQYTVWVRVNNYTGSNYFEIIEYCAVQYVWNRTRYIYLLTGYRAQCMYRPFHIKYMVSFHKADAEKRETKRGMIKAIYQRVSATCLKCYVYIYKHIFSIWPQGPGYQWGWLHI